MRLTAFLISLMALLVLLNSPAHAKRRWCKVGETPKTHKCDYLGSGSGG
jgi:hypothetical protein